MSTRTSRAVARSQNAARREDDEESIDEENVIGLSDSSEEESVDEDQESEDEQGSVEEERNGKAGAKQKLVLQGDEEVRAEGDMSSDEEQEKNTIGNVPLHWYDDFDHIGYDKSGKKIVRKEGMDEVDKYLASKDDPYYRRTVYDARNDQSVVLTDRELVMVKRMLESKFPETGFNPNPDYVDYFTSEKMIMPLLATPEPKRRFVPSKWERMKVMKIVRGIQEGRITVGKAKDAKKKDEPKVYLLWGDDDLVDEDSEEGMKKRKGPKHIPAPKVALPDHRESYHPPPEYLPTEEEAEEWRQAHPDDRKLDYLPSDHQTLRHVPAYSNFIQERFGRCLDLYMCPRVEKKRLNIDPESLVPKLPQPHELRPYPTTVAVTYFGHNGRVRALAVHPGGELLASGGDDGVVRIWEIDTGRCLAEYNVCKSTDSIEEETNKEEEKKKDAIIKLAWNPQHKYKVLAVALGSRVVLLNGNVSNAAPEETAESTFNMLTGALHEEVEDDDDEGSDKNEEAEDEEDDETSTEEKKRKRALKESKGIAAWVEDGDMESPASISNGSLCKTTIYFKEKDNNDIVDLSWHGKGEYLATVCNSKKHTHQVTIHHITKRLSQRPLEGKKDQRVQKILFHPKKPILFVATKHVVNVYHLLRQKRIRTLKSGARWISSMAVHPLGDNLIIGTYDRRVSWFDLDISNRPWKTLKYHKCAIRNVAFHPRYPLMASASDDGVIHVFHARVFDDFGKDPFVVPVKVLKGHSRTQDGLGVLDTVFHPQQPWLFSAGADGRVQLFQNLP
mmetsp:Transcript_14970/g.26205  ORF Transcript_14970/g.26205 Transcript_14970/m.26205 type:complete len:786 (-) Transcript_14970:3564-5921(-)|eukprot:CAMPEP_0203744968 /NCGR_PEP_ID=MMETSP0098-20131031/854_1 /ASSEMBLY_ACC=CAM_ASM_000208 /TAXON_ID=96639 /ORGANISM=" , Strain NY0313808BC1" /LENGTH=785 /DNA_ID=CAMNT_0050632621 /DNA_START=247 /DNA_END=2604 /DNA_ORIENTATION=-